MERTMQQADRDETEDPNTKSIADGSMFLAAYAVVATAGAAVAVALVAAL